MEEPTTGRRSLRLRRRCQLCGTGNTVQWYEWLPEGEEGEGKGEQVCDRCYEKVRESKASAPRQAAETSRTGNVSKGRAPGKKRKIDAVASSSPAESEAEVEEDGTGSRERRSADPPSRSGRQDEVDTTGGERSTRTQESQEDRRAANLRARAARFARGYTSGIAPQEQRRGRRGFAAAADAAAATPAGGVREEEEREEWPGPFSTAIGLVKRRQAAISARLAKLAESASKAEVAVWVPRERPANALHVQAVDVPRLFDKCLELLAKNIECVESFGCISGDARTKIVTALCRFHRLSSDVLPVVTEYGVSELTIPDCSNVEEHALAAALTRCSESDDQRERLRELRLGLCGRCFSDKAVAALRHSPSLRIITLSGCYRLSAKGFHNLLSLAPNVEILEISSNNRLNAESILDIAKLPNLRHLAIEDCPQLGDEELRPLSDLTLEHLSLVGATKITDQLVESLDFSALKSLHLARCPELTDAAVSFALEAANQLSELDVQDLHNLSDQAFEVLENRSIPLRRVLLSRCFKLSDATLSLLAQAANDVLEDISIAGLVNVTDLGLLELSRHCVKSLRKLDASFCRGLTDQGLGQLTDNCQNLRELSIWGNNQISKTFVHGHRIDDLKIFGRKGLNF